MGRVALCEPELDICTTRFLRFTCGATPDDCIEVSMAAEPFRSTYLRACPQALVPANISAGLGQGSNPRPSVRWAQFCIPLGHSDSALDYAFYPVLETDANISLANITVVGYITVITLTTVFHYEFDQCRVELFTILCMNSYVVILHNSYCRLFCSGSIDDGNKKKIRIKTNSEIMTKW